jgi:tetratricopeptide (TPR) repeat protein
MTETVTSAQLLQQGLFHHRHGQIAEAMDRYTQVLRTDPQNADALYYIAVVACQEGQFKQGVDLARRALAVGRPQARVHNLLGKALEQVGNPLEAMMAYDAAIALDPNFAEAHGNRATLLTQARMYDDALAAYDRALELDPKSLADWINRGALLQETGRHEEALANYDRALAFAPNDPSLLTNRATTLVRLGRNEEAEAVYEKAIRISPRLPLAHVQKGVLLKSLGRHAEAIACFDTALAIDPNDATALRHKADVLYPLGRVEEARALLEKAVVLQPNNVRLYFELGEMKRFSAGDPEIAAMEMLLPKLETGALDDLINVNFALAKAYDNVDRKPDSFRHLARANALHRGRLDYDEQAVFANFQRIAEVFTPEFMRSRGEQGNPSGIPVFIVGMPRSGSTLIEQILASHPDVYGAGELPDFRETMKRVAGSPAYPDFVTKLTSAQIGEIGESYVRAISAQAPTTATRITDKMPSNFALVGLIRLALPNARIIHARRDPVDTCYSCFATYFSSSQHFTYDLGELGRYFRAYEQLMDHWRQLLPADAMLEVQYEDLVADLETHARRLVAYCGLAWDEACLSFHTSSRPVYTASAAQVRQPLYTRSVGRWRAYAEELKPLLAALGRAA